MNSTADDARFMRACLRYARRHEALTGTNPSVGALIVRNGMIVGRGVTARGGRPHAEPIALAEAGEAARGATAYVTLEPCAHHGVTPPCAETLIAAKVARVVTAYVDPDGRVDGRGHAMLREAGVGVHAGLESGRAARDLSGYLARKVKQRPHVALKLALSSDGYLGREGEEVAITGPASRMQVHALRARHDAIMVGIGTVRSDDPDLTCRLPGLENRSPHRFVLDGAATLDARSWLAATARDVPVTVVTTMAELPSELQRQGVGHLRAERNGGELALPEMLNDMADRGHSSLMVEGGAAVARAFLDHDLVDRLVLFRSPNPLGNGIASPVRPDDVPGDFDRIDERRYGDDICFTYERRRCSPAS